MVLDGEYQFVWFGKELSLGPNSPQDWNLPEPSGTSGYLGSIVFAVRQQDVCECVYVCLCVSVSVCACV